MNNLKVPRLSKIPVIAKLHYGDVVNYAHVPHRPHVLYHYKRYIRPNFNYRINVYYVHKICERYFKRSKTS